MLGRAIALGRDRSPPSCETRGAGSVRGGPKGGYARARRVFQNTSCRWLEYAATAARTPKCLVKRSRSLNGSIVAPAVIRGVQFADEITRGPASMISIARLTLKEPDCELAHEHWSYNRAEVLVSSLCGCFRCLEIFSPADMTSWIDSG